MATPTQASLKLTKSFTYRGGTREFSNRYFLNSAVGPPDDGHWETFAAAVLDWEAAIFASDIAYVEAAGYRGGSDVPVWSEGLSSAGTSEYDDSNPYPGDCAAMLRWGTDVRTSKNHPIYLFNWYHGVYGTPAGPVDELNVTQKGNVESLAAQLVAGLSDGTTSWKRAGPFGAVALSGSCSAEVLHRDFRV